MDPTPEFAEIPDDEHEEVILVDEDNEPTGAAPKLAAHREGLLHRAFSIFVFDSRDRLLLQRRAAGKYHSPGLWSNTCCGHPRPGETTIDAATRRLAEEMGFACPLREVFSFLYTAAVGSSLVEHEYDHVFTGFADVTPVPNPLEVDEYRWVEVFRIEEELASAADTFSVWFPDAFRGLLRHGVPS